MSSADCAAVVEAAVDEGFTGAVRLDVRDAGTCRQAFGMRRRDLAVANTPETRFGVASVAKGFTAVTVLSAVERRELSLSTTARSLLGGDLPLIGDDVTVEHLLAHRSGIGDYLDEEALDAAGVDSDSYLMPVGVHRLLDTEDYLPILDGHPEKFVPDARFSYCNSGYVILALLLERATGRDVASLVAERVVEPAGMTATAFLRNDELPGDAAAGYLHPDDHRDRLRWNVLHLPVRGSGDGGIFTTVDDLHVFWEALAGGRLVSGEIVETMWTPTTTAAHGGLDYGLGFWLDDETVSLHGFDAGVGCVTVRDRAGRFDHSVIANTSRGAWSISATLTTMIRDLLG